jgi:hypothetical protein
MQLGSLEFKQLRQRNRSVGRVAKWCRRGWLKDAVIVFSWVGVCEAEVGCGGGVGPSMLELKKSVEGILLGTTETVKKGLLGKPPLRSRLARNLAQVCFLPERKTDSCEAALFFENPSMRNNTTGQRC